MIYEILSIILVGIVIWLWKNKKGKWWKILSVYLLFAAVGAWIPQSKETQPVVEHKPKVKQHKKHIKYHELDLNNYSTADENVKITDYYIQSYGVNPTSKKIFAVLTPTKNSDKYIYANFMNKNSERVYVGGRITVYGDLGADGPISKSQKRFDIDDKYIGKQALWFSGKSYKIK